MLHNEHKARENRVRRWAARHGLNLVKLRDRVTKANGWGEYCLKDGMLALGGVGLGLAEIEDILRGYDGTVNAAAQAGDGRRASGM